MTAKRLTLDALFSALALVMFLVESYLPPLFFFAPGVKIGFANIFIMLAAVLTGAADAIVVAVVKSVLGCIFGGNVFAILYSLPAALASAAVMTLLVSLCARIFSVTAISVASSAVFNVFQLIMSAVLTGSTAVFAYLPYVILIGCVAGAFTGLCAHLLIKNIPQRILSNI